MVRWVGFDMDECLGSFMPLWPFCEVLPNIAEVGANVKNAYLSDVAAVVARSEKLWVFRPGLDALLLALAQAHRKGAIAGCFILTNNGSQELTEVVRRALNIRTHTLARTRNTDTPDDLFVAGWHRNAPCRKKSASRSILSKDLAAVVACLRTARLAPITRTEDLLFYDDMPDHDLAKQIPHYVTVPAYQHYTPVGLVYSELRRVVQDYSFSQHAIAQTLELAEKHEERDLKTDKTILAYSPGRNTDHIGAFLRGFAQFLHGSPLRTKGTKVTKATRTKSTKGTRKLTQRTQKTRKTRKDKN